MHQQDHPGFAFILDLRDFARSHLEILLSQH
jgi:hypothetical protein